VTEASMGVDFVIAKPFKFAALMEAYTGLAPRTYQVGDAHSPKSIVGVSVKVAARITAQQTWACHHVLQF
jgi:hypothetical protein